MNVSKIKQWAFWIGMNFVWFITATIGFVAKYEPAANIFAFLMWFTAIMWTIVAVSKVLSEAAKSPIAIPERHIPGWLTFTTDFLLAVLCAETGNFFYAFLTIYQQMLESAVYGKPWERKLPT